MNFCRQVLSVLLLSAGVSAVRGAVGAQIAVAAGPLVGYYVPSGGSRPDDGPDSPGNYSGLALGGEVTLQSTHRVGARISAMLASKSATNFVNPGGWQEPLAGQVSTVNLLATWDVSPDQTRALWFGAGPGVIHHGGDAFRSSGNPTNAAGVLAVGAFLPLTNALGLTAGASALLYEYGGIFGPIGGPPRLDGSVATGSFARRFQRDIVIYGVLEWRSR